MSAGSTAATAYWQVSAIADARGAGRDKKGECELSSSTTLELTVTPATGDGSVANAAGSNGRPQRDRGDRFFRP